MMLISVVVFRLETTSIKTKQNKKSIKTDDIIILKILKT